MSEEKKITFKFKDQELSLPLPENYDIAISSFKKSFSINDEKMKISFLYFDGKDNISLDNEQDYLNLIEDSKKIDKIIIEGILEEEKVKDNPKINEIEENKKENIKSTIDINPPSVISIYHNDEKENEEINKEIKENQLEELNKEKESKEEINKDDGKKETMGEEKLIQIEEIINNDENKNEKQSILLSNDEPQINQSKGVINKSSKNKDIENKEISKENNNKEKNLTVEEIKEEESNENNYNDNNEKNVIISGIKKEEVSNQEDKDKSNNKTNTNINDNKNNINNINNNETFNNSNIKNKINNDNKYYIAGWIIIISIIVAFFAIFYPFIKNILEKEKPMTIIGIDFGSTNSGYSIIIDSNIFFDDSELNQVITSELIMDKEAEIGLRIGKKAHYFPKNRVEPENKLYFCKFKKSLDPKNNNNYAESNIPEGKKINLENVIKAYLVLLREEIQDNNRIKNKNINDIKWVLTVPPLWDEKGKKFMKEIAYKAGMIKSEIALEPEAASLAIFHDKSIKKKFLQKGKTFLIVDAGGYSVDISANKIIDNNNNLEQLLKPCSEAFGSNLINERIVEIIEAVYGKKKIEEVKKNDYEAWEKTLDEIEEKKKEIDDNTAENFRISIKFNKGKCGYTSDNCEGSFNGTKIQYSSTHINIPSQIIIDIISEIALNIVNMINRSFSKTNENIDLIVLTGGFSSCKIFEKKVRNNFKGSLKELVFLESPQETVMKGAAIFGLRPNQILYRISPATIAVNNYEIINEKEECQTLEEDENGNSRCLKYKVFIARGIAVKTNQIIQYKIKPINETINIYYSFDDEISQKDSNLLGTLEIPPSEISLENRTITVSMKFSNYINVTVMDEDSKKGNWKIIYYPS